MLSVLPSKLLLTLLLVLIALKINTAPTSHGSQYWGTRFDDVGAAVDVVADIVAGVNCPQKQQRLASGFRRESP